MVVRVLPVAVGVVGGCVAPVVVVPVDVVLGVVFAQFVVGGVVRCVSCACVVVCVCGCVCVGVCGRVFVCVSVVCVCVFV